MRLLFLAIPRDKWPAVIKELIRVTKPGGYIQLVEAPTRVFYYDPKNTAVVKEALAEDGPMGLEVLIREFAGERLVDMCSEAGLVDIEEKKASLPLGWNGPIGQLCLTNIRGLFSGLKPFAQSSAGLSDEEYDRICAEAAVDSGTPPWSSASLRTSTTTPASAAGAAKWSQGRGSRQASTTPGTTASSRSTPTAPCMPDWDPPALARWVVTAMDPLATLEDRMRSGDAEVYASLGTTIVQERICTEVFGSLSNEEIDSVICKPNGIKTVGERKMLQLLRDRARCAATEAPPSPLPREKRMLSVDNDEPSQPKKFRVVHVCVVDSDEDEAASVSASSNRELKMEAADEGAGVSSRGNSEFSQSLDGRFEEASEPYGVKLEPETKVQNGWTKAASLFSTSSLQATPSNPITPPPPNQLKDFFLGVCGPTVHACTATVVEIRYKAPPANRENLPVHEEDDEEAILRSIDRACDYEAQEEDGVYAAEIDFLSTDEWNSLLVLAANGFRAREERRRRLQENMNTANENTDPDAANQHLKAAFDTFCDEEEDEGNNKHARAIAMVKAVLAGTMSTSKEDLLAECANPMFEATLSYVGRKLKFSANSPREISRRIQRFLATSHKKKGAALSTPSSIWPLVKRATIRGPWALLSGGLVLVDLPGIGDADAARNQIVDSYIRRCNGILAVAPITRAADNKATKDLLSSESVMLGIKNSRISYIGFIATHSDICNTEDIAEELTDTFESLLQRGMDVESIPTQSISGETRSGVLAQLRNLGKTKSNLLRGGNPEESADVLSIDFQTQNYQKVLRMMSVIARNTFVSETLQSRFNDDFKDVLSSRSAKAKKLYTYCVSSVEYEAIMRDSPVASKLFTDVKGTGIPRLRRDLWRLSGVSSDIREKTEKHLVHSFRQSSTDADEANQEVAELINEKMEDFIKGLLADTDRHHDDLSINSLRDAMENEAREAAVVREAEVKSSETDVYDRTEYLHRIIACNNKSSESLKRFIQLCAEQTARPMASSQRFDIWKRQAEELIASPTPAPTEGGGASRLGSGSAFVEAEAMIAILGDSGAGKSSLLNALLCDKGDSVLPVSGVKACTAAPIEIGYCNEDCYKVVITFLEKKEWHAEVEQLLSDLSDEDGRLKVVNRRPRSEHGKVAYDKLMSVYGRIAPIESLRRSAREIESRLDTTTSFRSRSAISIRKALEGFVSSKAVASLMLSETEAGRLWPIVKKATLTGPFKILAGSGGRLLDLPGLQDSNSARNAVVETYLSRCTG
ncbi:hypothetical protein HK405_005189, partial [Cladochytrium tenue]